MNSIYDALIQQTASIYSVRWTLIKAIIQHESNFDPNAVGDGGAALGLMQMHQEAAEDVGADWSKLTNPAQAIRAGTAYFSNILKHFKGDESMALGAYNQGVWAMEDPHGHTLQKQRGMAYAAAVQTIEASYGDTKPGP